MTRRQKKVREVGVNARGMRIGEWHPSAVLSDAEVDLLRELHDEGWGYQRLAYKFGISKAAARDICLARHRAQIAVRFKRV